MMSSFFYLIFALFLSTYGHSGEVLKQNLLLDLSETEIFNLKSKQFVLKTAEVKNSPWPEITYYAMIEASPLESIALFAAYDLQKDCIPNLIKSIPIKHVSATDVHTEYELKIPFPFANAHYIHGAKIKNHDEDYETIWYLVQSTSAEEVRGSAYFQIYQGKTLLRYRSFVKPKSLFGSLVKNVMVKDVEKTIRAMVNFVEKNKREKSPQMIKYSEFITRALSGEFVYQTIILKN